MDPKETAQSLVDKFYFHVSEGNPIDENPEEERNKNAKLCALILARELIKEVQLINAVNRIDFWAEVKNQIEML